MGPENRRILLATVLAAAILIAWQVFLAPKPAPREAAAPGEGAPAPSASAPAPPPPAAPAPAPATAPVPESREELVALHGDGFEAVISTHGGALKSFVLEGEKYRREVGGTTVPIDLVRVAPGQPLPLAVVASPELGGPEDLAGSPAGRAPMRVVSREAKAVVLEGGTGNVGVRKTFRVTGKPFELSLEVAVSGADRPGAVVVLFPGHTPPDVRKGGFFSPPALDFVRPVCRAGDKTERLDPTGDASVVKVEGAVAWLGLDQHYFVAAALPREPLGSCLLARGPEKGSGLAALRVPVEGGSASLSLTVYAGPKDLDTLRGYGRSFESAVDYGAMARYFAFFARVLLYVMRWVHAVTHNWGAAIVLLTVIVKALLFPLTWKSMQSMNEMRKLQPEIEKLKAKHGSDREKLNLATMQLYQQHKVNPLGGCLPMLLQLPIWFALYATLQTSVELYRAPFLWIHDLTQHDPYFILPISMGVSQFAMQKISPQPADSAQAKMMLYFMPALFTVMMLFLPAGLTLYIFVNNLLSIVQQQLMLKYAPPAVAAPAK